MRYTFIFFMLIIIIGISNPAFSDWEEMIQVNTVNYEKQAPRDSDCPWPIAADQNGNIYTVWEDKHSDDLEVYFRKRNSDGTWNAQEKISNDDPIQDPLYGHPSICVLPGDYPPLLLTCYVREHDYNLPRELRGNTFDGDYWGDPSYDISDKSGNPNYVLPNARDGWGTNIIPLSDGKAYAFWQYIIDDDVELWFNEYDEGWTPGNEKSIYDDDGAEDHYSWHANACVDDDDNIHLVYSDYEIGEDSEIYYLSKNPEDDDFGDYPGNQISSSPENNSAVFPYCAVSEVADTTFLHVVWGNDPNAVVFYRKRNLETASWSAIVDTITHDIITKAGMPSVACDSYGNVHVVWEEEKEDGSYDLVKYRKFDYRLGQWGSITTLPADEEDIDRYGMPVIICDVFDNLHVLMTGQRVGASEPTDEEVYYSFWDAPPHTPQNLAQVFTGPPDYITISWDANSEPDLPDTLRQSTIPNIIKIVR